MPDLFKFCPNCAEQIRLEAIVCRFCHAEVPAGTPVAGAAPPPGVDTPEQQEKRRIALERIAFEKKRSRPFLALGWVAIAACVACFVAWAFKDVRESFGQHTFGILAGVALLASFVCFGTYLARRPRYTGDECPHCREFRVRRIVMPGVVTAIKVLRCDSCNAHLGTSGF